MERGEEEGHQYKYCIIILLLDKYKYNCKHKYKYKSVQIVYHHPTPGPNNLFSTRFCKDWVGLTFEEVICQIVLNKV